MGGLSRRRALAWVVQGAVALLLAAGLTTLGAQAASYPTPVNWKTCGGHDVLNVVTVKGETVGKVDQAMYGQGWGNATISGSSAQINNSMCVPFDSGLAYGGDTTLFCWWSNCRVHARIWQASTTRSTQFSAQDSSVSSASTEHCCAGGVHVVDSYNGGRDQMANAVVNGTPGSYWFWSWKYNGGTIRQPDGSYAPYDGYVAKICLQNTGC
jgi:hypothetical protein